MFRSALLPSAAAGLSTHAAMSVISLELEFHLRMEGVAGLTLKAVTFCIRCTATVTTSILAIACVAPEGLLGCIVPVLVMPQVVVGVAGLLLKAVTFCIRCMAPIQAKAGVAPEFLAFGESLVRQYCRAQRD